MKNEFGVQLDSNGYAPSLLSKESVCYFCRNSTVARHELFRSSNRAKSKMYGLWLNLCPIHHDMAHKDYELENAMQKQAQVKAMNEYGWSKKDFIEIFGKNYL